MKDRIILLIKAKNMTAAQFADEIGVQKSSISHILSGRNNASLDFIQKILITYPEVNMDWIMFGKGSIFKSSEIPPKVNAEDSLSVVSTTDLTHVDLFSELVPKKSVDFRKQNSLSPEAFSGENTKDIDTGTTDETHFHNINEFVSEENPNLKAGKLIHDSRQSGNDTKTIIKIVEFYSDSTFREFFPD